MPKPMTDLRATIGIAADRLMELEVGANTGAEDDETSADRLARRIDAAGLQVRPGGRIVGVRRDGRGEGLGSHFGCPPADRMQSPRGGGPRACATWCDPVRRGLSGVKRATRAAHEGINAAVARTDPGRRRAPATPRGGPDAPQAPEARRAHERPGAGRSGQRDRRRFLKRRTRPGAARRRTRRPRLRAIARNRLIAGGSRR